MSLAREKFRKFATRKATITLTATTVRVSAKATTSKSTEYWNSNNAIKKSSNDKAFNNSYNHNIYRKQQWVFDAMMHLG